MIVMTMMMIKHNSFINLTPVVLQVSRQKDDSTWRHSTVIQPNHDVDWIDAELTGVGSHLAGGRRVNVQHCSIHLVVADVEKITRLDRSAVDLWICNV